MAETGFAPMANAQGTLRNVHALLDPLPRRFRVGTRASDTASSHVVSIGLLQTAERKGRGQAAVAAVEVIRDAIEKAPEDPSLRNALGASLMAVARFESTANALALLVEAEREFQTASAEAAKQHAPRSTTLRYAINAATALWMRGERTEDSELAGGAVTALRSLASELSHASPYWAHVQDNLGNALMVLGRAAEAIEAYQAALANPRTPADRARSLNNLGTANAECGRLAEACQLYRDALALQPRDEMPLAWALAQHNLARALLQTAISGQRQAQTSAHLHAAIEAFEAALEVRQYSRMPHDWAITTANLANATLALGTLLCTRKQHAARRAGINRIRTGIDLYKASLPELSPTDQRKTVRNLMVAWQLLVGTLDALEAQAEVQAHRRDVLSFALRHGNPSLAKEMQAGPAELASVRTGSPTLHTDGPSHDLPPGLHWPTETYAQARKARRETIVQFLTRVWLPFIEVGVLDLRTLRARDPSAAKAIDNFQQGVDPATRQRRRLPPEIDIPTKKQLNDRLAAAVRSPGERPARLDWALRARARRSTSKGKI
jgi:tetratricopeptide (TPR) repeat protein